MQLDVESVEVALLDVGLLTRIRTCIHTRTSRAKSTPRLNSRRATAAPPLAHCSQRAEPSAVREPSDAPLVRTGSRGVVPHDRSCFAQWPQRAHLLGLALSDAPVTVVQIARSLPLLGQRSKLPRSAFPRINPASSAPLRPTP
eukprot:3654542-Pleurochrysis_carterae.AAC.7